jgi:DNA primase
MGGWYHEQRIVLSKEVRMFIDFAELKARVSIEQVVQMLGLQMRQTSGQLRGPCPFCKQGGDRALVITPAKSAYYCFAQQKGGDQIALAAHILGVSVKDAAQEIAQRAGIRTGTSKVSTSPRQQLPESETAKETQKLQPLSYLEADHPAVEAVGFDPDVAKAIGIGYAGKGIMRGCVAVPIRDEHGQLLGYIGVQEARLPPSFTGKVVQFPARTA